MQLKRVLAVAALAPTLVAVVACRHKTTTASAPSAPQALARQAAIVPDQVNTAGWGKAWTNLLNDAEQTFTPSSSRLVSVEVELVVGNPRQAEDELNLAVLDAAGQSLVAVTQTVPAANSDQVMFVLPKGGVELIPGHTYRLRLTGGPTFGWKYVVGRYEKGEAIFNGKPLLKDARSTFLFRTFGPPCNLGRGEAKPKHS